MGGGGQPMQSGEDEMETYKTLLDYSKIRVAPGSRPDAEQFRRNQMTKWYSELLGGYKEKRAQEQLSQFPTAGSTAKEKNASYFDAKRRGLENYLEPVLAQINPAPYEAGADPVEYEAMHALSRLLMGLK